MKETNEVIPKNGDPEAGKKLFIQRCSQCHNLEKGRHKTGPSLFGIIGRKTGSAEGYQYSVANKDRNIVWGRETLFRYLENPRKFIPGTKMVFKGLKSVQHRTDLISYLESACRES